MPSVKPLATDAVVAAARETRGIVTIEDALTSGMGGAVAELVTERHPCRVIRLGFDDTFAAGGPVEHIWQSHGLDAPAVVAAARQLIERA